MARLFVGPERQYVCARTGDARPARRGWLCVRQGDIVKRFVSIGVMTAMAMTTFALAAPARAWDSGNGDGSQPVISGDNFTTCAVRESAMIYCWGANGSGQLGRGDVSPSLAARSIITSA